MPLVSCGLTLDLASHSMCTNQLHNQSVRVGRPIKSIHLSLLFTSPFHNLNGRFRVSADFLWVCFINYKMEKYSFVDVNCFSSRHTAYPDHDNMFNVPWDNVAIVCDLKIHILRCVISIHYNTSIKLNIPFKTESHNELFVKNKKNTIKNLYLIIFMNKGLQVNHPMAFLSLITTMKLFKRNSETTMYLVMTKTLLILNDTK